MTTSDADAVYDRLLDRLELATAALRERGEEHWAKWLAADAQRIRAGDAYGLFTVSAVLGRFAAGQSFEQILADYPYLEPEDILAALEYAAAATQEREIPLTAAG